MSSPQRPGAPRSSARPSRAPRAGGVRVGPPARPGEFASSGATPRVRPRIEAAPVRGSVAALLSWRTLVLAGVLGLAFALVWPSVRVYVAQRHDEDELRAERDAAQAEVDDLNAQLDRWQDPTYVVAQARERLAYVFPGESPFRVVDPEVARPAAEGSVDAQAAGHDPTEQGPWYDRLWSTLERDGATPSPAPMPASGETTGSGSQGVVVPPAADEPTQPTPGANVDLGG